jgi:hypothetical protein
MANLTVGQILDLIKAPKNQKELQLAKVKRTRSKLHTEPEIDELQQSESLRLFFLWVGKILNNTENHNRFIQLCRVPVITNKLVDTIFSEFEKVFEAQNAFQKFTFTSPEMEQSFNDYRRQIGDFNFWETQGMDTFKNSIDNMVVIDMPAERKPGSEPAPYYYILDICNIIDVDNTKLVGRDPSDTNKEFYYFKTEYLISKGEKINDNQLIHAFDDTYFRTFIKDKNNNITLVSETPHNLGYCPARSFWTTPLNSNTTIQRSNPITDNLSDLDWFLFLSVAERYLQLYAPFPIYVLYKSKCNYSDRIGNQEEKCVDGFLEITGQRRIGKDKKPCPKCSQKMQVGPGNTMLIDAPYDKEQYDKMSNPMKVIPAERDSLDYIRTTLREMKRDIFTACVGRSKDTGNAQAKNEMEVSSEFESSESVLLKIKRNFEIIHEFTITTVARLKYGNQFISGVVNYGDKFFTKDEARAEQEYNSAVENQLPEYELQNRREDLNNTRYKNDPIKMERVRILDNLLPYPDMSMKALSELRKTNPDEVSQRDFIIKLNFNNYIARFEREQSNINQFASALSFDRKIQLIRDSLNSYVDEYLATLEPPKPDPVPPVDDPVIV